MSQVGWSMLRGADGASAVWLQKTDVVAFKALMDIRAYMVAMRCPPIAGN